eukprot:CAMPEP_0116870214 /NCGR_PEP_ID=MMETSP0463-20121206/80_1 /TAXON_ID=181622 /ORGANISM="Strombidinopsis sp, Strain SopsisLIS2011" /LENGTH=39 /DNA_ID= /DNA_START= /DNA_END= /DNA_ORIENTATION=
MTIPPTLQAMKVADPTSHVSTITPSPSSSTIVPSDISPV